MKSGNPLSAAMAAGMAGAILLWVPSGASAVGQCFWLSNTTNKWTSWPQASSKEQCYYRDSCNGGLGESLGGCYKWAASAAAPREPWTFSCASPATPAKQAKAVNILPAGEASRPMAREALTAILAMVQSHYLVATGKTFQIASNPTTSLRSALTAQQQTGWDANYATIANDCRNGLVSDKNLVISAPQATTGDAGGSWGATKMTKSFWDKAYEVYLREPHKFGAEMHGWSHESGHAFGLGHTYDMDRACWSDITASDPKKNGPSLIMYKTSTRASLYDYPFTSDEKKALLDPTSSQSGVCLPLRSNANVTGAQNRPHASEYLRLTKLQNFDLTQGRPVSFVWMNVDRGRGGSLRMVGARQWKEADASGKDNFSFTETERSNSIVTLLDPSRKIRLRIDIRAMKVLYSPRVAGAFGPLYDITWAKAGGPY